MLDQVIFRGPFQPGLLSDQTYKMIGASKNIFRGKIFKITCHISQEVHQKVWIHNPWW